MIPLILKGLLSIIFTVAISSGSDVSVVMTMMIRDEEVNLKTNLELWMPFIDYFVFIVDKRSSDGSVFVINDKLKNRNKFKIFYNEFSGFGPTRTLSLERAWESFPQASHILIADPDWKPDISTIKKNELESDADAYRFLIYDRNGDTTRRCDWLLKHRKGLKMRYNLHEVLDIGTQYKMKTISWTIHEIEKPGTWHSKVGHGHSMSLQRYFFDLELLYKDLKQYGHDPHTHYYLGVTNEAVFTKSVQKGEHHKKFEQYLNESIKYLKLRIQSTYEHEFFEERWGALLTLRDYEKAALWLTMCREFSQANTECSVALIRLYLSTGRLKHANDELRIVLQTKKQQRQMLNFYKSYDCDVPMLALEIFAHRFRLESSSFNAEDAKYMH
eukprot:gene11112-23222_t